MNRPRSILLLVDFAPRSVAAVKRLAGGMSMLVVPVVLMPVVVLDEGVPMQVPVLLRQVQPQADSHQDGRRYQRHGRAFA